jgi:hypothetical protein
MRIAFPRDLERSGYFSRRPVESLNRSSMFGAYIYPAKRPETSQKSERNKNSYTSGPFVLVADRLDPRLRNNNA